MRILYGVTGFGFGHTMRSGTLAAHLASRGHDVRIAASGRAAAVLREEFHVTPITGMRMECEGGAVKRHATVRHLFRTAPRALAANTRVAIDLMREFDPEIVITDFDTFAWAVGASLGRPVISVDHQHVIDRFHHPRSLTRGVSNYRATRAIVGAKTPGCARYVVTSFFFPEATRPRTSLVGPIVRPAIAEAAPSDGDHVLVYQTTAGDPRLVPALRAHPHVRFIVYGLGERPTADNVTFAPFDQESFVRDLASARSVITNGGYTTLGEAIFLGKPALSIPVRRQPEQELNAAYLAESGLGLTAPAITPALVGRFLDRAHDLRRAPDPRIRSGTSDACAALDRAIREVA